MSAIASSSSVKNRGEERAGTSAPTKGKPITARVWTANNMKPLNVTLRYKGSSGVWLNRGDNLKALREAGLVANTTIEKYVFYMKRGKRWRPANWNTQLRLRKDEALLLRVKGVTELKDWEEYAT
ncbi:hypothetical protein MVEN_00684800 [Mycena venus]|uniref:Uncharacterized protein n=1 Tax=Mycena venus TaxID=2733690 RepID=A0A8H6YEF3_9AGAR|nr:hypothetical protein MVEN_00684800 [Mycena venus]